MAKSRGKGSHNGQSNPTTNGQAASPIGEMWHDPIALNRLHDIITNVLSPTSLSRASLLNGQLDPRRSVDDECGYPPIDMPVGIHTYKQLYDRCGPANRLVQLLPKECFQVSPSIYEDEDADNITEFEEAWDSLGQQLNVGQSFYNEEEGSRVWEYLMRADSLSRIGQFGIVLLGIDDGKNLQEPVDGMVELSWSTTPIKKNITSKLTGKQEERQVGVTRQITDRTQPMPDSPMSEEEEKNLKSPPSQEVWDKTSRETNPNTGQPETKVKTKTVSPPPLAPGQLQQVQNWASERQHILATEAQIKQLVANGRYTEAAQVAVYSRVPGPLMNLTVNERRAVGHGYQLVVNAGGFPPPKPTAPPAAPMPARPMPVRRPPPRGSAPGQPPASPGAAPPSIQPTMTESPTAGDIDSPRGPGQDRTPNNLFQRTRPDGFQSDMQGNPSRPIGVDVQDQMPSGMSPRARLGAGPGTVDDRRGQFDDTGPDTSSGLGSTGEPDGNQGLRMPKMGGAPTGEAKGQTPGAPRGASEPGGAGAQGTDQQYGTSSSGFSAGYGMPPAAMSGTDQQYYGVQLGPSEQISEDNVPTPKRLLFVRCFDESLVQIVRYEWNIRNPRFGLPVMYRVTLNDPREAHSGVGLPLATVFVHWSRIVHLADVHANAGASEIFAPPIMRSVLNYLLDLYKVPAAASEGYWQSGTPTKVFSTHPQLGGDVLVDKSEIQDEIEQVLNSLQKFLIGRGGKWELLAPSMVDPTPYIEGLIKLICMTIGIPMRVFMGSERGELASTQDDASWNDRLRNRQNAYLTPRVICPFIDRLIAVGVLPEPQQGYRVEWPDLDSLTDKDKAAIFTSLVTGLGTWAEKGLEQYVPMEELLTKFTGGLFNEDEARAMSQAGMDNQAMMEQRQMQQQQMMMDQMGTMGSMADQHGFKLDAEQFGMVDPEKEDMEHEQAMAVAKNPPPMGHPGGGFPGGPSGAGGPPKPGGGGTPPGGGGVPLPGGGAGSSKGGIQQPNVGKIQITPPHVGPGGNPMAPHQPAGPSRPGGPKPPAQPNRFVGNYSPDQPRDERGEWTGDGGGHLSEPQKQFPHMAHLLNGTKKVHATGLRRMEAKRTTQALRSQGVFAAYMKDTKTGRFFVVNYDPDQPRDDAGKWTEGAGGGSASGRTSGFLRRMFGSARRALGFEEFNPEEKEGPFPAKAHEIEHTAHQGLLVRPGAEVSELLATDLFGGHPVAKEAIQAANEAVHAGGAVAKISHLEAGAIVAGELLGPAIKAAVHIIDKVPGAHAVARLIDRTHEACKEVADRLTQKLVDRYGAATAAAILATGHFVSHELGGLGGPAAHVVPGKEFIGAIPALAVAEAGKRLGLLGPNSKLEKSLSYVGTWVHAFKHALAHVSGGAVRTGAYGAGVLTGLGIKTGKKVAGLGKEVAGKASEWVSPGSSQKHLPRLTPRMSTNAEPEQLTTAEIESAARDYYRELAMEMRAVIARETARYEFESEDDKPTANYNPDQPRDPAGSPTGGQWTEGGGSGGGGAPPSNREERRQQDLKTFNILKSQWAQKNNEMLRYVNQPDSPEAKAGMEEMKNIVKKISKLDVDPGGWKGIGLPGGPRDMVIVGAGPGGLAAAVMGGTDGLDTLFIDAGGKTGGQAKYSSRIENYPGFPIGTTGKQLAEKMYEQAQRVGAEGKIGVRVTGLSYDPKTGFKTVSLSNGESVTARAVIIAGGVEFRKMEFPGSENKNVIYGNGEELAKVGAGKPVVVIGGSNGAAQAALGAAETASRVYVLSRSPIQKGMSDYQVSALHNHPKISVIEGDEIAAFQGDHLRTKGGKELPASAVGLFIGGASDTSWLPKDIKVKDHKIEVNDGLETSIPGVFAIGDIRHGSIGRIGAAVGDGQIAEHSVFGYFERMKGKEAK